MLLCMILAVLISGAGVTDTVLVRQAQEDLKGGRFLEARQKLEKAVKAAPDDAEAWSYLGLACSRLDQTDAAIAAFQRALAILANQPQIYFDLGILYWKKGDLGKALEMYQEGLRLNPADVAANENYALLLMRMGKYGQAVGPLERVKREKEFDLQVRVALIEAFFKGGMDAEGQGETEELLKGRIASPAEKVKLAVALVEDNQPTLAERVLRTVVASSPDLADGHGVLGIVYLKEKSYKDAVYELGRAVQLDPNSAEYSMGLAEGLLGWKNYVNAIDFLKAVENRFGTLPDFRLKLALAYYGERLYPKAIIEFQKVLQQPPPRIDSVHYYLGHSYFFTSDFGKAEFYYKKAIEINPKNASYYLALGLLLRKLGPRRLDEAIENLQMSTKLDPLDPEARIQLALCDEAKGEFAPAEALVEEVVQTQPELLRAHVILSRVYHSSGREDKANREKGIITALEETKRRENEMRLAPGPDNEPQSAPGLGIGEEEGEASQKRSPTP